MTDTDKKQRFCSNKIFSDKIYGNFLLFFFFVFCCFLYFYYHDTDIFCMYWSAIAIDDLTYKKFHPSIRPPFAVQLELPITGHSVGFASTNLTLKNMQDTFNTNSMETLQIQSVRIIMSSILLSPISVELTLVTFTHYTSVNFSNLD